jgi:hypothetical protein
MSIVMDNPPTLQQRSIEATNDLCRVLNLEGESSANLKYLALALMHVATEEIAKNGQFGDRVRSAYLELIPQPKVKKTSSGSAGVKPWQIKLTPIGTADESLLDPYGPPNPFALQQIYGEEQLPLALERYTPAQLKEALPLVQSRYPGTKPKKMTKAAIIDYIASCLIANEQLSTATT